MQIFDRQGAVEFRLTVHEARRIRDAVAIVRRAARNLDGDGGVKLSLAAALFDEFQLRWTPASERLDHEDQAIGVPEVEG